MKKRNFNLIHGGSLLRSARLPALCIALLVSSEIVASESLLLAAAVVCILSGMIAFKAYEKRNALRGTL